MKADVAERLERACGLARAKVLLAEEDELVREHLAQALREDGYDVIEVEDGFELLDYIFSFPGGSDASSVDVIIADAAMSGYGGVEVLDRLRRMHVGTPFVIISRRPDGALYEDAERAGADLVIGNVWDVEEVRSAVLLLSQGA